MDLSRLERLSARAGQISAEINRVVEFLVAMLLALLVLNVWIAVLDRYLLGWQLPWPEVLARFLMIWAALLAASSGVARREHIGLGMLTNGLPFRFRRPLLIAIDCAAILLFVCIFWYGLEFAQKGGGRQAQIFDMTLLVPFAAVPVSMALCLLQLVLTGLRDLGRYRVGGTSGEQPS